MAAEWHPEASSQAYESRYKSMQSEEDTRNPTTNKKIHGTPVQFRRSNPYLSVPDPSPKHTKHHSKYRSISQQLYQQHQVGTFCRLASCSACEKGVQNRQSHFTIAYNLRIKQVSFEQKREKRAVSAAHKNEMRHLHRLWQEYFHNLRQREIDILESFKNFQRQEIRTARQKLQKRCASMRTHSRQRQELKRKEGQCIAQWQIQQLLHVRKELKELDKREEQGKQKQATRWAQLQEERLSGSQSRKYNALMSRLEEYRQDKEKVYLREQKRLRQKYKNVLAQLKHEQAMELTSLTRMLTFDH